jgi:hypothetical protein
MNSWFFRCLTWLNRKHWVMTRFACAAATMVIVGIVTRKNALAFEAAQLWSDDQFSLASRRLNWYIRHSRFGRLGYKNSVSPLFDPTTGMDSLAVAKIEDWLKPRSGTRDKLALLYVLARKLQDAQDVKVQNNLIADFEQVASSLRCALPAFTSMPIKNAINPAYFTVKDAQSALSALDRNLTMPWYIISGTFLGAVREGTFLSHDYDIDIGIHAENFDEVTFLKVLDRSPDLTLVNTSAYRHMREVDGLLIDVTLPALYRVLHVSGVGIDVFIHHLDGNIRWHGSAKHRWDNSNFDLASYTIDSFPVRGPADANSYLTENYGDWRTPVTEFDCSTGTPNVLFNRNLSAISETLRVAILSQNQSAAMTAQFILKHEGYLPDCGGFIIPWARNL